MKVLVPLSILFLIGDPSNSRAQERVRVPEESAIQEASELVKETYKEEFNAAKSNAQKFTLANRLFALALKMNEPASKYAILSIAKSMYLDQKEYDYTIAVLDELNKHFDYPALEETVELLDEAAASTRGKTGNLRLYKLIQDKVRTALENNDITTASRLNENIERVARRTNNRELLELASAQAKQFEEIDDLLKQVEASRSVLEKLPEDPQANSVVGSYLCFVNNDWVQGLPLLKSGSDEQYRIAAMTELSAGSTPLSIGDHWWTIAENLDGFSKQIVKEHAADWYLKDFESYSGLTKIRVKKRLNEILPREEISANLTLPRRFDVIISNDDHEGSAGARHTDHVYHLKSFIDHQMQETRIQFQGAPDQGISSEGEILISFDNKQWTTIGGWSEDSNKAFQRYDGWHELVLSADDRKTSQEFWIKFEYKKGLRRFAIRSVRWVR